MEDKNVKKKPNVILFTLLMIFVFIFITEGIWGYGRTLLYSAIVGYPQGSLVIREAILAFMVLIVMLLFKNSYVFTQKRESFKTGLFYGLFYLIGSVVFCLISIDGFKSGLALVNLVLGCLLVGICEEFLCRGWLLNEFLERYGNTKKGIWYSIIISGVIFGLMHVGNIFGGQSVPITVIQMISAAGTGILFGLIYYKTKNIWSVIFLHGLWDFSLFLGDVVPVSESIEAISKFSIIGILFTLLMVFAELLNIIPHVKDINAKPKKGAVIVCSIVSFILYMAFTVINGLSSTKFGEVYEYKNISLDHFAITRDNYEEYNINHTINNNNYLFRLSESDNGNLLLTNLITNDYVEIECESLYDYIIFDNKDNYILAYVDYTDSANAFLNYVYIRKAELSNDNQYLNTIKNNIKKYLLPERLELLVVNDYDNNKSYLGAYDVDYGYYLLTNENEVSVLNKN